MEVNKQLLDDLDELRSHGGHDCAILNYFPGLDSADVLLYLSCDFLQKIALEAWGLSADEPIIIKLCEVNVWVYRNTVGSPFLHKNLFDRSFSRIPPQRSVHPVKAG